MLNLQTNQGFTLIELLIVILLISITMSIAYPSYSVYVERGHRLNAKMALTSLAAAMEQHYALQANYITAAEDNDGVNPINRLAKPLIFAHASPLDQAKKVYQLRIRQASYTQFIVQAIPVDDALMAEDGLLQLDSDGQWAWDKNNSGSIDAEEYCWHIKDCG